MSTQYKNSKGQVLELGKELGKGGAGTVYQLRTDQSKALKIFKPEVLQKEVNLAKRIEKLNQLANHANIDMLFGNHKKTIGAWPKDTINDSRGKLVGYVMDTVHGGIDLSHVVWARNAKSAFYKYKGTPNHSLWVDNFIYQPQSLRNRFILAYYLAVYFNKIYNLQDKFGSVIDIEICNFDIKPQNILVSIEKMGNEHHVVPYILDLDNLTLKSKTTTLAPSNTQVTQLYFAAEGPKDKFYDYYSIAVIFHQLILDQHPFEFTSPNGTRFSNGTDFTYFRDNKCYPWGRNRKFLDPAIFQNNWRWGNFTRLSDDLQQLFLRAFDSDLPSQRPSMLEWSNALADFIQNRSTPFEKLFRFQ